MKFGIISLGCPKNEADSEIIRYMLEEIGLNYDPKTPEILIINTCAFIKDAVKESLTVIASAEEAKRNGRFKKVIVTGCIVNRFKHTLLQSFPLIDAWRGCACIEPEEILRSNPEKIIIENPTISYKRLFSRGISGRPLYPDRKYRYVRIAEGCNNSCSFCIIPQLRGRYQSRKPQMIIDEVQQSVDMGIKEIILVAQDLTEYGKDIGSSLAKLLSSILSIRGDFWVRMLYLYPGKIDKELINIVNKNREKLLPYFDIPIQHIDDDILKSMRRKVRSKEIRKEIEMIRSVPDSVIRATVMVGFPGEDERRFRKLLSFIRETEFERLGTFVFSNEKNVGFKNKPKLGVSRRRYKRVMMLQQDMSRKKNESLIGKELKVLVEGYDKENDVFYGRSYMDAPEIDGLVWLKGAKLIDVGNFKMVKIEDALEYDLIGEIVS